MTDKDKIEVGDVVSVFFATSPMFYNATVLYTPCSRSSGRITSARGRTSHAENQEDADRVRGVYL